MDKGKQRKAKKKDDWKSDRFYTPPLNKEKRERKLSGLCGDSEAPFFGSSCNVKLRAALPLESFTLSRITSLHTQVTAPLPGAVDLSAGIGGTSLQHDSLFASGGPAPPNADSYMERQRHFPLSLRQQLCSGSDESA